MGFMQPRQDASPSESSARESRALACVTARWKLRGLFAAVGLSAVERGALAL